MLDDDYNSLNKKKIEDAYQEIIDKRIANGERIPSIKHDVWEEDGQKYSMWTIDTGNNITITGNGGMEMFNKAIKEWARKSNKEKGI